MGNVTAVEQHLAGGQCVHAAEYVEQRGLARAGRADDDADFALFNFKGNIAQGVNGNFAHAVLFFDLTEFDVGHAHPPPPFIPV